MVHPPVVLTDSKRSWMKRVMFDHVIQEVLGISDDDLLLKALDGHGTIISLPDLLTMSDSDIDSLYLDDGTGERLPSLASRNKVRILRWWNYHLQVVQGRRVVDWMDSSTVNEVEWDSYRYGVYVPTSEPVLDPRALRTRFVARVAPLSSRHPTKVAAVPNVDHHCTTHDEQGDPDVKIGPFDCLAVVIDGEFSLKSDNESDALQDVEVLELAVIQVMTPDPEPSSGFILDDHASALDCSGDIRTIKPCIPDVIQVQVPISASDGPSPPDPCPLGVLTPIDCANDKNNNNDLRLDRVVEPGDDDGGSTPCDAIGPDVTIDNEIGTGFVTFRQPSDDDITSGVHGFVVHRFVDGGAADFIVGTSRCDGHRGIIPNQCFLTTMTFADSYENILVHYGVKVSLDGSHFVFDPGGGVKDKLFGRSDPFSPEQRKRSIWVRCFWIAGSRNHKGFVMMKNNSTRFDRSIAALTLFSGLMILLFIQWTMVDYFGSVFEDCKVGTCPSNPLPMSYILVEDDFQIPLSNVTMDFYLALPVDNQGCRKMTDSDTDCTVDCHDHRDSTECGKTFALRTNNRICHEDCYIASDYHDGEEYHQNIVADCPRPIPGFESNFVFDPGGDDCADPTRSFGPFTTAKMGDNNGKLVLGCDAGDVVFGSMHDADLPNSCCCIFVDTCPNSTTKTVADDACCSRDDCCDVWCIGTEQNFAMMNEDSRITTEGYCRMLVGHCSGWWYWCWHQHAA